MGRITDFIKTNYLSLLIGLCFYGIYMYYNTNGNQICDCETTENYRPTQGNRSSINHFYHK
ncbi:hypothetical protein [Flavobacterium sp.]|uniref:hypothetical protein n=1 Tax=Flavobacterium sp. TaxID=239 RepID=UPI00261EF56B|nr:hypothetical protein [Flavobacterium sp.]MDG2432212.1 hypothetical protein [Flavobacterium sp.]